MKGREIYLDNSATTRVFPEVVKEMQKYYLREYGNPGSPHKMGEDARKAIDDARRKIAEEIGARPHEVIFTSGGTEANNMAMFGLERKKILISSIEHSSIREPCLRLRDKGYEVIEIKVNKDGLLDLEELEREIEQNAIVSIIHGNNEIGVIQDLRRIGEICRKKMALLHTDAVQSFGKERINVREMNIDLLTASAHKIGGPKGIGFLYIKEGVELNLLTFGGKQEAGRRAGTENVPAIAGFAKALEIIKKVDKEKIKELRDWLILKLEKIGGKINGSREKRLWNNINVSFNFDSELLVLKLSQKEIYCSARSACLTKQKEESHVLKAIGLSDKEINGSIRLGLFVDTKKSELERAVREINKLFR